MPKIPDCDRCQFYAHDDHLVCAVHPQGVEEKCGDFQADPNFVGEEQWSPGGYYCWEGELYPMGSTGITPEERLAILNSHPLLTGKCPQCGADCNQQGYEAYCPVCGWEN
jgi:hypothetical protein